MYKELKKWKFKLIGKGEFKDVSDKIEAGTLEEVVRAIDLQYCLDLYAGIDIEVDK